MAETGSAVAGVPDHFYSPRNFNELAMNPFFLVVDREQMVRAMRRVRRWRRLRLRPEWFERARYPWNPDIRREAVEYESFYCFFWLFYESDMPLLYLYPHEDFRFANEAGGLPRDGCAPGAVVTRRVRARLVQPSVGRRPIIASVTPARCAGSRRDAPRCGRREPPTRVARPRRPAVDPRPGRERRRRRSRAAPGHGPSARRSLRRGGRRGRGRPAFRRGCGRRYARVTSPRTTCPRQSA